MSLRNDVRSRIVKPVGPSMESFSLQDQIELSLEDCIAELSAAQRDQAYSMEGVIGEVRDDYRHTKEGVQRFYDNDGRMKDMKGKGAIIATTTAVTQISGYVVKLIALILRAAKHGVLRIANFIRKGGVKRTYAIIKRLARQLRIRPTSATATAMQQLLDTDNGFRDKYTSLCNQLANITGIPQGEIYDKKYLFHGVGELVKVYGEAVRVNVHIPVSNSAVLDRSSSHIVQLLNSIKALHNGSKAQPLLKGLDDNINSMFKVCYGHDYSGPDSINGIKGIGELGKAINAITEATTAPKLITDPSNDLYTKFITGLKDGDVVHDALVTLSKSDNFVKVDGLDRNSAETVQYTSNILMALTRYYTALADAIGKLSSWYNILDHAAVLISAAEAGMNTGNISTESADVNDLISSEEDENLPDLNMTDDDVDQDDILVNLAEALVDIDIDTRSMEALLIVADTTKLGTTSNAALESAVMDVLANGLREPTAASRIIGRGIQSTADVIALEAIAKNAAMSHWVSLGQKASKLLAESGEITRVTEQSARNITEQFRAMKKQVTDFKGAKKPIGIVSIVGEAGKLDTVIRNTQEAVAHDLSLKNTQIYDRVIDNLVKSVVTGVGRKQNVAGVIDATNRTLEGIPSNPKIVEGLGIYRHTLKDNKGVTTLAQGIALSAAGGAGKFSYPKYQPNHSYGTTQTELTPQLARQLYDLGMYIGREIGEQSRMWDNRFKTLSNIIELANKQSRTTDEDRVVWAAEQKAAATTVSMWTTVTNARRYYINLYNKIALDILKLLQVNTSIRVSTESQEISQEILGWVLGKKTEKVPGPKKLSFEEKLAFVKANIEHTKPVTGSGVKIEVGKSIGVKNVYTELARELPIYTNTIKPEAFTRVYSQLNSAISKVEQLDDLDTDEPWVNLQYLIQRDHVFTPEKIFGMRYKGDKFVTPFNVLTNLMWLPRYSSFDIEYGNDLELPTMDTNTIKRLLPLIETTWKASDEDNAVQKINFSVDLWGEDHFKKNIVEGLANYIIANKDNISDIVDIMYMSVEECKPDPDGDHEFR